MSLTDTAAYQNRKAELQAEREDKQKTFERLCWTILSIFCVIVFGGGALSLIGDDIDDHRRCLGRHADTARCINRNLP